MRTSPLFEVDVRGFEPHSLRAKKGGHKAMVKGAFCKAILTNAGEDEVREARERLKGRKLDVDVGFFLLRKSVHKSDTTEKKDLDNLLKPLLDILQTQFDKADSGKGLGLVEDDEAVYSLSARKQLVDTDSEQGFHLIIREWDVTKS